MVGGGMAAGGKLTKTKGLKKILKEGKRVKGLKTQIYRWGKEKL